MNMSARSPRPVREALPFRIGVGIVIFDAAGRIWLGSRRPRWLPAASAPVWQMPQGGIIGRELPLDAALREAWEETGTRRLTPVAEIEDWTQYELPDHLLGVALKGHYRGQRQRWFAARFEGSDGDFDLGARGADKREFESWMWARPDDVLARAVPWKRGLYGTVLDAFADVSPAQT